MAENVNSPAQEAGSADDQWTANPMELLNAHNDASFVATAAPTMVATAPVAGGGASPPAPLTIAPSIFAQQHFGHGQQNGIFFNAHLAPMALPLQLMQHALHPTTAGNHHTHTTSIVMPPDIPYHNTNNPQQMTTQQPMQQFVADPMAPNNPIITNTNGGMADFSIMGLPEEEGAAGADNAVSNGNALPAEQSKDAVEGQAIALFVPANQLIGRKPRKDFAHRLKEIQDFKVKFGHCMIPHKYPPNPSLGTWIDTQRRRHRKFTQMKTKFEAENPECDEKSYEEYMQRGGPHIKEEHIDQLIEIGFVFEPRLSRKDTWQKRVEEMGAFKDHHGHCNVREDDKRYPGLGKWVSYVRRTFRLAKKKRKGNGGSKLTSDKIVQLKSMGFVFELKEELAMKRFKGGLHDLKRFYDKEGHCLVPNFYVDNPTFGLCVEDMRTEYRNICANESKKGGKACSEIMSAEIVEELAKLGFLSEEGIISPHATIPASQEKDPRNETEAENGETKENLETMSSEKANEDRTCNC